MYTYYTETETEVVLSLASPAQPDRQPTFNDPGEPGWAAEWDVESVTFLGVPVTQSGYAIAKLLWPTDSASRNKFTTAYYRLCSEAEMDANENYETEE